MVSLTGKSLITRWIPLNDHCFYLLSFSAAEILLHGFLAFLSFFRSDYKKPYQDRYKLAIILSTYVYIRTMTSKIGRVQQTLCLFGWTLWNAFMVLFLHWNLNWNNCSYMKTILFNLLSNKIIQYYRRLDKHFVGIICYWTIHI